MSEQVTSRPGLHRARGFRLISEKLLAAHVPGNIKITLSPLRRAVGKEEVSEDVRRSQRSLCVFRFRKQLVKGAAAAGEPLGCVLHHGPAEGNVGLTCRHVRLK